LTPTLLVLPLALTGPVEPLTPLTILGITAKATPLKYDVSLKGGLTARGKVLALGGSGDIGMATGLAAPRQVDVTLTELDAVQVAALLGDSLPVVIRDKLKGRIGKVAVQVRGDIVTVNAEKFRLIGDWLSRAEGTADLKTGKYTMKMYAFGGLLEAEGKLPEETLNTVRGSSGRGVDAQTRRP
jgi:hypothetical protein